MQTAKVGHRGAWGTRTWDPKGTWGTLGMDGNVEDERGLKDAGLKSADLGEMSQLLGGDKMVPFALCSGTWGSEEGLRL